MGHADGRVWDEASRDQELKALVRVSETNKREERQGPNDERTLVSEQCFKTALMQFYVLNTGDSSVTVTDDLLFNILNHT